MKERGALRMGEHNKQAVLCSLSVSYGGAWTVLMANSPKNKTYMPAPERAQLPLLHYFEPTGIFLCFDTSYIIF